MTSNSSLAQVYTLISDWDLRCGVAVDQSWDCIPSTYDNTYYFNEKTNEWSYESTYGITKYYAYNVKRYQGEVRELSFEYETNSGGIWRVYVDLFKMTITMVSDNNPMVWTFYLSEAYHSEL